MKNIASVCAVLCMFLFCGAVYAGCCPPATPGACAGCSVSPSNCGLCAGPTASLDPTARHESPRKPIASGPTKGGGKKETKSSYHSSPFASRDEYRPSSVQMTAAAKNSTADCCAPGGAKSESDTLSKLSSLMSAAPRVTAASSLSTKGEAFPRASASGGIVPAIWTPSPAGASAPVSRPRFADNRSDKTSARPNCCPPATQEKAPSAEDRGRFDAPGPAPRQCGGCGGSCPFNR
jgi:hypothetical protein